MNPFLLAAYVASICAKAFGPLAMAQCFGSHWYAPWYRQWEPPIPKEKFRGRRT